MRAVLRMAGAAFCASLAFGLTSPASAGVNLLTNGGFEDVGGASKQPDWDGYTFGPGFSEPLPGWTINSGNVDITTNSSAWSPAYEGSNSLDINGWNAGSISQSFDTLSGATYVVRFAFTRNAASAPDPATADVSVTVGPTTYNVSAPNDPSRFGSANNFLWETGTFTFVGTGNTETITLAATVPGNGGVFFDAVSVAIPEPATWALMIGGFGLAGTALRRRRALGLAA